MEQNMKIIRKAKKENLLSMNRSSIIINQINPNICSKIHLHSKTRRNRKDRNITIKNSRSSSTNKNTRRKKKKKNKSNNCLKGIIFSTGNQRLNNTTSMKRTTPKR